MRSPVIPFNPHEDRLFYDSTAEQPGRNKRDQLTNVLDSVSSDMEDIRYNVEHMKTVMSALEQVEQQNPRVRNTATALNAQDIQEFLRIKREGTSPSVPASSPTTASGRSRGPRLSLPDPSPPTDVSSTGLNHMLVDAAASGAPSGHTDIRCDLTDVSSAGLSLVDSAEDGEEGLTYSDMEQTEINPVVNPPSSPRTFLLPPRISTVSTLTTLSSGSSNIEASMPYATPIVGGTSHPKSPKTYRPTRRAQRLTGQQTTDPSPSVAEGQAITRSRPRPAPRGRGRLVPSTSIRKNTVTPVSGSSGFPPNRAYVAIPPLPTSRPRDHPRDVVDLTLPPLVIDLCSPQPSASSSDLPEVLN